VDLLLIRHAQPVRIDGLSDDAPAADPALHADGVAQAARLATALASAGLDALYCSPMRRALETAAPIAAATGLEVRVEEGLAEFDQGSTSYIPLEEMQATRDPRLERWAAGDVSDLVGDPVMFQERVTETVASIVAAHPSRIVAVVCHGGVINGYVAGLLGSPHLTWAHHDYTGITRVAVSRGGAITVRGMNDHAHLLPALSPLA
jgi:broad specificity phosphatase PhoE